MQNAGRRALQQFPVIKSTDELAAQLENWIELYKKYGGAWGESHARTALLDILPSDIREKTLDRDDISTVMDFARYARRQVRWAKSETLARQVTKQYSAHIRQAPVAAVPWSP